jgi:oligoribonuclease NrnB/cAMP/cGMP phosphodiesterase (DHH superfamily)
VTGVVEYCIKNNYLSSASGASSVKDQLMSKLSSKESPTSDSGYTDGAKGMLDSSNGKQLDLSGGGLKAEATKQVCDKILAQAKSML